MTYGEHPDEGTIYQLRREHQLAELQRLIDAEHETMTATAEDVDRWLRRTQ